MHRCQYGERFPTWAKFKDEYRNVAGPSFQGDGGTYCLEGGACVKGKIFYRAYNRKTKTVHDLVGSCVECSLEKGNLGKVTPGKLHRDKLGVYRLSEALFWDRKNGDLSPHNDPETKMVFQEPALPANAKNIVKEIFGKDNPAQEEVRRKNLYENREKEKVRNGKEG